MINEPISLSHFHFLNLPIGGCVPHTAIRVEEQGGRLGQRGKTCLQAARLTAPQGGE